jgi:hypothetical protein
MHGDGWSYLMIGVLGWYLIRRVRRADQASVESHRNANR